MVTVHREGKYNTAYVKGAGDYILEQCTGILVRGKILPMTQVQRMKIRQAMESMARDALRVLALAMKERAGEVTDEGLMKGWSLLALQG